MYKSEIKEVNESFELNKWEKMREIFEECLCYAF